MKTFICVVLLAAAVVAVAQAVSTPDFKKKVEPLAKLCKEKDPESKNATPEDVSAVVNREDLKTKDAKCLQLCVYSKVGAIKEGKPVSYEEALAVYQKLYEGDEEKLKGAAELVKKCSEQAKKSGKEGCELAEVVQTCFRSA